MRANLRLGVALAAGAFALSPTATLAQEAPPATTNTPAADAVGPRELQGFSLKGTVTQQSNQPTQAPRTRAQSSAAPARATESASARTAPGESRPTQTAAAQPAPAQPRPEPRQSVASAAPAPTPVPSSVDHPTETAGAVPLTASAATPAFAPEPASLELAPEHKISLLPWLLAALALGAGGAFLFFRNRSRHAFAGGPQVDAFVAPEPAPAPRPAPAPKAKSPPPTSGSAGIVSTRLRPWIELGFSPVRCVLDNEKLVMEFEIELFNSGSAPARAVLVEASLFNAGPTQDEDIGKFFANPVAAGERIPVIAPLKRLSVKAQVAIGREQLQAYEAAGRQLIVPLIAFNVLYRWSGAEGQTSVGYLLGREAKGDKMAPFRIDLGPRIFRGLAARLLPGGVRS